MWEGGRCECGADRTSCCMHSLHYLEVLLHHSMSVVIHLQDDGSAGYVRKKKDCEKKKMADQPIKHTTGSGRTA